MAGSHSIKLSVSEKTREYNREYARKYRAKNKAKRHEIERRSREKLKEESRKRRRDSYERRKEVAKKSMAERRRRNKEFVDNIKRATGCMVCGERDIECLDFHHRDESKKVMCVALGVKSWHNQQKLIAEIEKCDLLCSNCHRRHHHGNMRLDVKRGRPKLVAEYHGMPLFQEAGEDERTAECSG